MLVLVQSGDQPSQCHLAPELLGDPSRVDHVVPVVAAGSGLQDRRAVKVCDTKRGEVPGARDGIVEPELFRELKTVGGADLQHKASHKRARQPRQYRIRRFSGTSYR